MSYSTKGTRLRKSEAHSAELITTYDASNGARQSSEPDVPEIYGPN